MDNIMGQSSSNSAGHRQFLKEYQLEARNNDLHLTFLSHRITQQHFLLREMSFTDPKEFEKMRLQLQRRHLLVHPCTIRLARVESEQQESICSRVFKLYALWEHSSVTLSDEINQRALQRCPFDQIALINLLRVLAGGLLHFSALGAAYDSLTTRSILVGWGGFKLIDPQMVQTVRNIEAVHVNRNVKNIYLSPQECKAVELETHGDVWSYGEAVFTAGVIALEAATLQRQDKCYSNQCSRVSWSAVEENLQKVAERYGKDIREVIASMLQCDITKRIELRQLWEKMEQLSACTRKGKKYEEKQMRPPSTYHKNPQQIKWDNSMSRVSNDCKPTPAYFSNQKLRISQAESLYSPQRLVQTTYARTRPSIQQKKTVSKRPLPLLEMKTINTITQLTPSTQPLYSFDRELTTNRAHQCLQFDPPPNDSITSGSSQSIKLKVYEHHAPSNPLARYFVEQFKQGSKFEGFKVGGRRQGWGRFHFQDGGLYQGEWRDNKMHGYGRLYYQSGKLAYEGQWDMDQFSGKGKLYNESHSPLKQAFDFKNLTEMEDYWIYYQGNFMKDSKWGQGMLQLTNGQYFRGLFERDQITGDGQFFSLDGRKVKGRWRCGKLEKILQIINPL